MSGDLVARFWSLVRKMPLADFMSLLRCGQARPTIYLYNHFDRSAIRAPQGTVAWPVEHLLTSYHKKHVFLPQMRPSIAEVNKAFALWSRKLLWRIYFDEHVVDDERERYRHLRSRRPLTAFCPYEPSVEVRGFLNAAQYELHNSALRNRSAHSQFWTFPPVCRVAMRMLHESIYGSITTDKDFGWSIIRKADLLTLESEILASDKYRREALTSDSVQELISEYCFAANWIGVKHDQALCRALMSDITNKQFIFQRLVMTLKTHKPAGQVKPRAIHSSVNHPFRPGHRWVAGLLKPLLRGTPYLFASSKAMASKVASIPVPGNARFWKLDVEEFYMSGLHGDLVLQATRSLSETSSATMKKGFQKMLRAILSSQVLRLREDSSGPYFWRVVKGSGMGTLCSSEVSNTAFLHRVERRWIDSPGVINRFGLIFYGRYEDDIFVISTASDDDLALFIRIMNSRAKFFNVKVESVTVDSCDVLDITFHKGERWRHCGKLDYRVYTKPTSHWQPLAHSSGHPPATHSAWPRAMIQRYFALSSNSTVARLNSASFISALRHRCGPFADHFHALTTSIRPDGHSVNRERALARRSSQVYDISFPWVIIPYRPQWLKARIAYLLNLVASRWFRDPAPILCGWRLSESHLHIRLRSLNEKYQSLPHFEFFHPPDDR